MPESIKEELFFETCVFEFCEGEFMIVIGVIGVEEVECELFEHGVRIDSAFESIHTFQHLQQFLFINVATVVYIKRNECEAKSLFQAASFHNCIASCEITEVNHSFIFLIKSIEEMFTRPLIKLRITKQN